MRGLIKNRKIPLTVLIVLILAGFFRFYNFTERINFSPEQAISLIVAGNYITEKPSLLGEENVQRVTSFGHRIFHPPIFNYSLVPLLLLFNYDPIPVTVYFTVLNLVTGLVLFIVVKKILSLQIALISLIFFLFDKTMIYHSLFIWNQNYIPLLAILGAWCIYLISKKQNHGRRVLCFSFLAGLFAGLAVGIEFLFAVTAGLFFILIVILTKRRFYAGLFFVIGTLVSLSPMILFDLKHEFYFTKTLFQYLIDTFQRPSQSLINYYHFLQFWPLIMVVAGYLFVFIFKRQKYLALGLLIIYIGWNLWPTNTKYNTSVGMETGFNIIKLQTAAQAIAQDQPKNFNVAALLNFDSRAHPLRYYLKFKYGLKPAGVEQYQEIDSLYVLAKSSYDFNQALVYEINTYRPFNVALLKELDENYSVYKLKHIQ